MVDALGEIPRTFQFTVQVPGSVLAPGADLEREITSRLTDLGALVLGVVELTGPDRETASREITPEEAALQTQLNMPIGGVGWAWPETVDGPTSVRLKNVLERGGATTLRHLFILGSKGLLTLPQVAAPSASIIAEAASANLREDTQIEFKAKPTIQDIAECTTRLNQIPGVLFFPEWGELRKRSVEDLVRMPLAEVLALTQRTRLPEPAASVDADKVRAAYEKMLTFFGSLTEAWQAYGDQQDTPS